MRNATTPARRSLCWECKKRPVSEHGGYLCDECDERGAEISNGSLEAERREREGEDA